jgi:hypothetical protein
MTVHAALMWLFGEEAGSGVLTPSTRMGSESE